MKRIWIIAVLLLFSGVAFSQSWIGLGPTGGYDYNFNKYYNSNAYSAFEHENMDFNTGVDLILRFSKKVRFRIELRYAQMNYGQKISNGVFSKSDVKLHCMDINPRFDIRVWTKKKFELFLSSGLRLQYVIDSHVDTYYENGEISFNTNYYDSDYKDALPAFVAGTILKYNINKHLGLTFSPNFYFSSKKLYGQNNGNIMGIKTNVGVEYFF